MNLLLQVKLSNSSNYDYIVSSLYKEITIPPETEGEPPIVSQVPISDIEGSTALLLTDGTSWELNNGEWIKTEENVDYIINNNVLSFLMSVCHSIHRHFVKCKYAACERGVLLLPIENDMTKVAITNVSEILVQSGDFVWLKTDVGEYLTQVDSINIDGKSITLNISGYDVRITGKPQNIALCGAYFPADFLAVAIKMFAYDLFDRSGKELKQERLGNYTYTNFSPMEYYGDENSYPKEYINVIKYYQRITV